MSLGILKQGDLKQKKTLSIGPDYYITKFIVGGLPWNAKIYGETIHFHREVSENFPKRQFGVQARP